MKEIFNAKKSLEAYLIISALFLLETKTGASKSLYTSCINSPAVEDSTPKTTLAGYKVSLTAVPCAKNSGFEAIYTFTLLARFDLIRSSTLLLVPIGTVDLITTTQSFSILSAICVAAE